MKKVSLLVTAIAVLLLCFACDNNEPVNKKNEQEERFKAIAASYLEHTVFPTYTELARQADQLVADLKTLRADKTQANLEKACTTFLAARAAWEKSEAFLFGPANDFGIDPHIDSWPLDEDAFNTGMNNHELLENLDTEEGDVYAGSNLSPNLLGFHGIEYILFENGHAKQVSQISDLYMVYVIAVAGDLRNSCYQLEVSWMGDKAPAKHVQRMAALEYNVTVAGSEQSYGENMLHAGLPGSTYPSTTAVMQAILDGCVSIADEVGASKIGKPNSGEDVSYIESPYSWNSITDFYDNILSVKNSYYGGIEGNRDETNSLHAYMSSKMPALDLQIVAAIDTALNAIGQNGSGMKYPFVNNIADPTAKAASEACSALASVIDQAKTAIAQ